MSGGATNTPNPNVFGNVVVDNNASITATSGDGIFAFNYGIGDLTVSDGPSGSITANARGIAAGSTPAGFTQYGINAYNYGSGNVTVATAIGSPIASGGTGISAGNQATAIAPDANGNALSAVTVDALGPVSSGANLNNNNNAPAAIQAGYNPGGSGVPASVSGIAVTGDVLVIDGGNLTAAAGDGISAYNYANGNITVDVGFNVAITAEFSATSPNGGNAPYGIGAFSWGIGNIAITTSGSDTVNSGSTGLFAVNQSNPTAPAAKTTVTVNSFGNINFGGIPTNSNASPSGISAGYSGGNVAAPNMDVNGAVIVNNSANITPTVFNGVAAAGIGINAFNYGNGDITVNDNSGTTVSGVQYGIDAHAEGGTGTNAPTGNIAVDIATNATVSATTSYGILAFSTDVGNISVITSSGDVINGGSAGINAVNEQANIPSSANSSISVTAAGTINSGTALTGTGKEPAGILAGYLGGTTIPTALPINVNGEVVVNNSATINAAGGDGIRAYNYGIGNVTVNEFSGKITALDASDPTPAGYGIGIAANNFGSGNTFVNMTAGTINSGGSGIAAINQASSDAALPSIPSTSVVSVLAYGIINSGSITTNTNTIVKDPAAGILAGYDPGNADTVDANVHGNVAIDDYADITSAAGTDGIRAINYGTFDSNGAGGTITVTVEASAVISAGRYGVAALGFDGGNVTVTNKGSIVGATDAVDAMTTGSGTASIDNSGYLGGNVNAYNATFTNELGADWSINGASVFTGASTLTNLGLIESNGISTITGLAGAANSGTIEVETGSLKITGPVTGGGAVLIFGATMEFAAASNAQVQFEAGASIAGSLVLDDVAQFTGSVTGFSTGDTIDLVGINPANVSISNSGGLHVNYGTGSFALVGNYDPAGFSVATDNNGGTDIVWKPTVNAVPILNSAQLTVSKSGATVLTNSDFSVTDPNSSSFTYSVSNVTGGQFEVFNGTNWVSAPTGGFTTAQISAGKVEFVQDGSNTVPNFQIWASDGPGGTNAGPAIAPTISSTNTDYSWSVVRYPSAVQGKHIFGVNPQYDALAGVVGLGSFETFNYSTTDTQLSAARFFEALDPFFLPGQNQLQWINTSTVDVPSRSNFILPNVSFSGTLKPEGIFVYKGQLNPDGAGGNALWEVVGTPDSNGDGGVMWSAPTEIGDSSTTGETMYNLTESYKNNGSNPLVAKATSFDIAWDQYDGANYHLELAITTFNSDGSLGTPTIITPVIDENNDTSLTVADPAHLPAWQFRAFSSSATAAYMLAIAESDNTTNPLLNLSVPHDVIHFQSYGNAPSFNFTIQPDLTHYATGATNAIVWQTIPSISPFPGQTVQAIQFQQVSSANNSNYIVAWNETVTDSNGTHDQVEFAVANSGTGAVIFQTTFQMADGDPQNVRIGAFVDPVNSSQDDVVVVYGDDTGTHILEYAVTNSGNTVSQIANFTDPTTQTFGNLTVMGDGRITITYDELVNALPDETSQYAFKTFDLRTSGLTVNDSTGSDQVNKYFAGTHYTDTVTGENNVNNEYYFVGQDSLNGPPVDHFTGGSNGWNIAIFGDGRSDYTISTDGSGNTTIGSNGLDPGHSGSLVTANVQVLAFDPGADPTPHNGIIDVNGGTDVVLGGNSAITIEAGSAVEIDTAAAYTGNVTFEAPTGTLVLDQPGAFTGQIAGISGTGQVLNLTAAGLAASDLDPVHDTLVASTGQGSFNGTTTTLTVTDTTTGHFLNFNLAGDLSSSTWTVTSDGHGGVNMVDPPPAAFQSNANINLQGMPGNDVIFASANSDVLTGGGGADQFVFKPTDGPNPVQHTITDFSPSIDTIDLRQFAAISTSTPLTEVQSGNDALITLDSQDSLILKNVAVASLHADNFIMHA
jgi:hypothetical protein